MQFFNESLQALSDFQSWNEGKQPGESISIFDYLGLTATPDLLIRDESSRWSVYC